MRTYKVGRSLNRLIGLVTLSLVGLLALSACGADVTLPPASTPTISATTAATTAAPTATAAPTTTTAAPTATTIAATATTAPAKTPTVRPTRAATATATPKIASAPLPKDPSTVKGLNLLYATPSAPGHISSVTSLALSPDGKILASGSDDKTIKLWNLNSDGTPGGKLGTTLVGHTGFVLSVAFSPDGKTLASGGYDGLIKLWDVASGKELNGWKEAEGVSAVTFSPDGKYLLSGSYENVVRLREIATGREVYSIKVGDKGEITDLVYSPDGKTIAGAGGAFTLALWEAETGKPLGTLPGHTGETFKVIFSPDGKLLASTSNDKTAKLWDIATKKALFTLTIDKDSVETVVFSPDGKTLIAGGKYGGVTSWDVTSGKEIVSYPQKDRNGLAHSTYGDIEALNFSQDGKFLLAATGFLGNNSGILFLDPATFAQVGIIANSRESGFPVVISPDGKTFARGESTPAAKSVKIWQTDATSPKVITTLTTPDSVKALAFSPDGTMLAAGLQDHSAIIWSLADGKQLAVLKAHKYAVNAVAFSPDGKTLATGSVDEIIILWDISSGQQVHSFLPDRHGTGNEVLTVAFTPDGKTLVGGYYANQIIMWDLATSKARLTISEPNSLRTTVLSKDGKFVVTGTGSYSSSQVHIWDINSGELLKSFKGHTDTVNKVALSDDNRTVFSSSEDGTLRVWDVASSTTKTIFSTQLPQTYGVMGLALSPDGQLLISYHQDTSLKFWQVQ